MRQETALALAEYSNNREKLLELMASIDAEKRSIKSRLRRLSSEPDGKFGRGRERQVQIRKMQDKLGFLTEEREAVRARLGKLKLDEKALNRAANRPKGFAEAFLAAAERELDAEQFAHLEQYAALIL